MSNEDTDVQKIGDFFFFIIWVYFKECMKSCGLYLTSTFYHFPFIMKTYLISY